MRVTVLQFVYALIPFIVTFLLWVGKRWVEGIVHEMQARIDQRTYPIQKTANGGFSLPDVVRAVDKIDCRISELHEKVNDVARDFEHLRGRFDQYLEKP